MSSSSVPYAASSGSVLREHWMLSLRQLDLVYEKTYVTRLKSLAVLLLLYDATLNPSKSAKINLLR
jgi:hypothetical protein